MRKLVFFIFAGIPLLTIISLACVPVVLHIRHKQRMRKYIPRIRKAFGGVLLNGRERLLLQAYLDAMECIGLRDEVMADCKKSEDEEVQRFLDEIGAIEK